MENGTGLRHLHVSDDILGLIERISMDDLVSVYGACFTPLVGVCKKAYGWKGNIVYENLKPDWLRGDVAFLYGPNRASSIPCKYGVLPRKGVFKDRDQKLLVPPLLRIGFSMRQPRLALCDESSILFFLALA